jgi:hypothetical protein
MVVMTSHRKRMAPWLAGLILAVVVFLVILVVANLLGLGDDPSLGALALI